MKFLILFLLSFAGMAQQNPYQFTQAASVTYDKATWGLCVSGVCTVGAITNIVPWVNAMGTLTPVKCYARATTGPTGAALIIDLLKNGTTTIFGANKLQIAAGQTAGTTTVFAASLTLADGDYILPSITQIGSTVAGQYVNVTCRFTVQ